jgi:hypothetical protein
MNTPPRLQTTARANELVKQYNRESASPFKPRPLTGHALRVHYLTHINRARLEGFDGLATELMRMYEVQFPAI